MRSMVDAIHEDSPIIMIYGNSHSRGSLILKALRRRGGSEEVFVPEHITTDQLLEYHRPRISRIQVTEEDVLKILQYPDQFRKLQDALRNEHCVTNGFLSMRFHQLMRERLLEVRELELEIAHKAHASQLEMEQRRVEREMMYLRAMEAEREVEENQRIKALHSELNNETGDVYLAEFDSDGEKENVVQTSGSIAVGKPLNRISEKVPTGSDTDSTTSANSELTQ
jgi:hypothetical protein